MSDAIADAARLLLTEASPETVRAVLRMLLDDVAPAPASRTVRPPPASPPRPGRKRAAGRATANGVDAEWEALRRQVRQATRERGTSYVELAAAIGRSAATTKINVSRRLPASGPVQAGLRAWLEAAEQAAEVAAPALPFRAARGNGPATAQRGDSAATRVHAGAAG